MHTLEGMPLHGHYQDLLSTGDSQFAWAILHEFFEAFGEEGPDNIIWFMLAAVMKSENEEITSRHRAKILFFYEYSQAFFKAAHILYTKNSPGEE